MFGSGHLSIVCHPSVSIKIARSEDSGILVDVKCNHTVGKTLAMSATNCAIMLAMPIDHTISASMQLN